MPEQIDWTGDDGPAKPPPKRRKASRQGVGAAEGSRRRGSAAPGHAPEAPGSREAPGPGGSPGGPQATGTRPAPAATGNREAPKAAATPDAPESTGVTGAADADQAPAAGGEDGAAAFPGTEPLAKKGLRVVPVVTGAVVDRGGNFLFYVDGHEDARSAVQAQLNHLLGSGPVREEHLARARARVRHLLERLTRPR